MCPALCIGKALQAFSIVPHQPYQLGHHPLGSPCLEGIHVFPVDRPVWK